MEPFLSLLAYNICIGIGYVFDIFQNFRTTSIKDVDPPVSEQELKNMDILRQFDLNWEYGPSVGITRLERWERAEKHGLHPSADVKQLVVNHPNDEKYTMCVWNDYKNVV